MTKPKIEKKIHIPDEILKDLLTPSEWRMLRNRFHILNLLEEGLTIRQIAEKARVGTDTVVRTIRMVEKNNLKVKLNSGRKFKTSTPWIFGKSD